MRVKAVTIPRFGGPEVLEVQELPRPRPGAGEVLVRVAAATVNPTDLALRSGARRPELPPPYIPGMELAGVVAEAGEGVAWPSPGDRVMAIVVPTRPEGGAQAEYVRVACDAMAPVPEGITLEAAATLPMNGLTVRRAFDLLGLPRGAKLAVTGSAGAVGGYAIELGKRLGLQVVADAAPTDEALVRGFGADIVVPRGDDVARAIRAAVPEGVDALIDAAVQGARVLPAIRDGGQLAAVRAFQGESERGIRIHHVLVTEYAHHGTALGELARMAGEGLITLRVAGTYPPEEASEAHRRLAAGGVRGRLLITF